MWSGSGEARRLRRSRGPKPGDVVGGDTFQPLSAGGASLVCEERAPYTVAPAPLFVPRRLAEGELPPIPREELAHLVETELLRLGACEAQLDLEMGRALRSCRQATVQEFGYSSLESYFPEALGFSRRVASEMITLAVRLSELPRLREAFLAGALPRSRVRIACSVATSETDLQWTLACLRHPTRRLQEMAKAAKRRKAPAPRNLRASPLGDVVDAPESDQVRVRLRMSADEAAFVEHVGVPMLQAVVGTSGPKHALFEALAADTLAELGPESPRDPAAAAREFIAAARGERAGSPHDHDPEGGACESSARPLGASEEARADRRLRQSLHRLRMRLGGVPAVAWPQSGSMTSPAEIHARLVQLAAWRNGLAWQRGRLLSIVHECGLWRERKHASFHEWSEHRLGLGPQECRRLIDLSRRVASLPQVDTAWRDGRVDPVAVSLLRQVATPETESDWLSLTAEATRKRVEMEVAAQLALRSQLGWSRAMQRTGGRPQRDLPMHALRSRWDEEIERKSRARRARQAAGATGADAGQPADSPYDLDGTFADRGACEREMFAGPPMGRQRRTLAFDAPRAVAALIQEALRQVARAIGWTLDVGGCLVVMLHRFAETHVVPALEERSVRARVLRRDGWQCFMPRCRSRRGLDVHHVVFRSKGGGNAMTNLITLCHRCHRLLHDGKLFLTGEAPSGLLVRMGHPGSGPGPGRLVEWLREGIRIATGPPDEDAGA